MLKWVVSLLYLILVFAFVESATRFDEVKKILKGAARTSLEFIICFLAIGLIFYFLNVLLFY
jgi:hypothetical protein